MIVIGPAASRITSSLVTASIVHFGGNLKFRVEPKLVGLTRDGRFKHHVQLGVRDNKGPGAYISSSGRRTSNACWHAHGRFIDLLPEGTIVKGIRGETQPGERWVDAEVGNTYHSSLCLCSKDDPNVKHWPYYLGPEKKGE